MTRFILALSAILALFSFVPGFRDCGPGPCPDPPFQPAQLQRSVVQVRDSDGGGSGVAFQSHDGEVWILTAAHVVGNADLMTVRTFAGVESKALVVRSSTDDDLALLLAVDSIRVQTPSLSPSAGQIGDQTFMVGCPFLIHEFTVSSGILSYHGRNLPTWGFRDQTSAPSFPGNSGGGVFNSTGQLLGVLVSGQGETISYFIPNRSIIPWADQVGISDLFHGGSLDVEELLNSEVEQ